LVSACWLCYLATSFTWLLIFRLLQGVFAGASVALPIAIVRDQVSEASAGPYIAKIAMIVGLAPMVAPALGTLVLEFSGWRGIFLMQALLGFVLTTYILRALAEPQAFTPSHFAGTVDILHRARQVYSNKGFLVPTLIYSTLFSAMFSFLAGAPAVFIEGYGFSEYQLIAVLALTSFGMFSGSLLNSYLLKHKRARPVTLIRVPCAVTAAAATVLLVVALTGQPHYGLVTACCWLCVFMFGLSAPSSNHQAIYALNTHKGLGAGFIRTTQMLIAAVAGSVVSLLAVTFNALLASAIMMTAMAWVALLTFVGWNQAR
jgi:DHA1 family bicyclomycin/chloramphenicol resistance-like MFS transporter